MKAVIVEKFGPLGDAQFKEMIDPTPDSNEVIVDMKAAEANYPDILVMEGQYQFKPPLPFTPGKAGAGIVSAIGVDVSDLKVGDRVGVQVEFGAYAEKLRVAAVNCFSMLDDMPFEIGAALGLVYQTAYFALRERGRIKAGETVLVLGAAGGVGSASCQLAKAMGAKMVIGCVADIAQVPVAKEVGCDHVIVTNRDDLREHLRNEIYTQTNGVGVDIIIDPVGGDVFAAAIRCVAWCGRLVVIGFASGEIPEVRASYLLVKNIEVSGLQWSDYRERDPALVSKVQSEIYNLWKQGKISPHISKTLPITEFEIALEGIRSGQSTGKTILLL